ncbi:hypothetical protein [Magnetospirillum sp. 15-1]|uniref:hypothetical protein n=1 Tax=Magnetospirillum sp. 15-1 TaxID=1979370 RepID=UPI001143D732|nr:hypothetical protein [Magnetospirillum sp. 15-1]
MNTMISTATMDTSPSVPLSTQLPKKVRVVTDAFRIAVTLPGGSPPTKKAIKEALRERGLKLSLLADVEAAWRELVEARKNAERNRLVRRFGRMPCRSNNHNRTSRLVLFEGTVQERLRDIRRNIVLRTYLRTYATSRRWGSEQVELVTSPTLVGVSQYQTNHRSGQWIGTSTHTVISAPENWRIRVPAELKVCDGMMTLDASPMDTPRDDVTVWQAKWIFQGRGFSVRAVDGFIAAHDGQYYHADTMAAAITGVARKARIAKQTPRDKHGARVKALRKRVAACPDRTVTKQDAYAVGACRYGVESWCNAVGLGDHESATLAEVLDGYIKHPAPEARQVILAATWDALPPPPKLNPKENSHES